MKITLVVALVVALGLLSFQTWMTWSARQEPVRLAAQARQLDACAALGAAAADFSAKAALARRGAARGALGVETFEILRDAPRELNRALFVAGYLLPAAMADDLDLMQDAAQKSVTAAFQGNGDRLQRLIDDFDGAARNAQTACRELAAASPFVAD